MAPREARFPAAGEQPARHEKELTAAALSVAAPAIPPLTIRGEADTLNTVDRARLAQFGGEALVLPDAGHPPHIESARAANERLVAFLRPLGAGRSPFKETS